MNQQRRNLARFYVHFRNRVMSPWALFLFNWRAYAALFAAGGFVAGTFLYLEQRQWAEGVVLFCTACLARDVGHFRRASRNWPVLREVLDWSKVESLGSHNKSTN